MSHPEGGNRPNPQIGQLRPAEATSGAGDPSFSNPDQIPDTSILNAHIPARMPERRGGNRREQDERIPTDTRHGRNRGWSNLRDFAGDHKIALTVGGVVAAVGIGAGAFLGARGAFGSSSNPNPETGGNTATATLTGEPTKTEQPTLTATATPTPAETATPVPTEAPQQLLPFTVGKENSYLDGKIKTVIDENLMEASPTVKYKTKGGTEYESQISGISEIKVESPEAAQDILNFFNDITYRKWVQENPEALNVSYEQFLSAYQQGAVSIEGVQIPLQKIFTFGLSNNIDSLQIQLQNSLFYGVRENNEEIAFISSLLHKGVEGISAELGPNISENNLAMMGALWIYGDLERGGVVDIYGDHYRSEILPLALELIDSHFSNPNIIQAVPHTDN